MSLLRESPLSSPFRNILKEINITQNKNVENVNEIFEVRKQIYDNRELFYKVTESNQIVLENQNEIDEITENVKKGRQMLLEELSKNRELVNDKNNLDEFKTISLNICTENLQNIKHLKLCFDNQEFNTDDLQNFIDNIEYSIGNIIDLVNENVKNKADKINSNFEKNTSLIKSLSDLYNIFKSTSSLHTCPSCMLNESNVFCNCGHTFCNTCIDKSKYCYMCRAPITKINKLYLS